MGSFFDTVERLLAQAIVKSGKSKSKLLGLTGIGTTQWDRYIRERRVFSNTMLEAMAQSEYFDISEEELEALALIERKGGEKAKLITAQVEAALQSHPQTDLARKGFKAINEERKKK